MNKRRKQEQVMAALLVMVLVLTMVPLMGAPAVYAQTAVFINEIHYDNTDTDAGEAIEIAGSAGTDLTGWSLVLYNGYNGTAYNTTSLSGLIPDQQNGFGTVAVSYPVNGIQNGSPDGLALVGPGDSVIQFLSYEGTFVAVGGPADGLTSTDIGVSEPSDAPVGYSLQLSGTGTVYEDFSWNAPAAHTFGAVNTGQTFGDTPPPPVVINEFSASTTGTDVEYVEIYGDPNTDYSAYKILEIEGDFYLAATGTVDEVISLGTTDASGLYLASLPANALENGTITLLLVKDFTGAADDDLDTNEDGAFDVTPWSAIVDAVAVNDGGASDLTYGQPVLTAYYDGLAYAPGGASRIPDGYDTDAATDWVRNDFDLAGIPGFEGTPIVGEAYNTPGALNQAVTEEASDPVINEFSASTTGTDVEYVEIYGEPNTDYSAYKILEIEGDFYLAATGTVDEVISLGTTDANGLYLANLPANALENGTITLLLVKDFTGAAGDDLDTNEDGTFDVTPWSAIVDAVAVSDGGGSDLTYGEPVLTAYYDGLPYAPGGASRYPDGLDTDTVNDWVRNDFDLAGIPGYTGSITLGEAYNTPGEPNAIYVPPPEACGDPYTPIYEIQGSGLTSPLVGTEVAVEGVVVGDFQNNTALDDGNLNGFHIQDPMGDGVTATSDGIFIYYPSGTTDVLTGDAVRVRGTVSEYNGLTEITVSQLWICSNGNSVTATPISLPVAAIDDLEAYEGMFVTFPQPLVISEYYNYDRYGEIVLTSQRLDQPTAIYDPGSPEQVALAQANLLSRITLDDGRTTQNPDPAIHPNGSEFTMDNLFRGGDTVTGVTGVLDYSFGLYRIQPTQGANYDATVNPRTAVPGDVGGNLKVASFNVLNYFTTIDTGAWICGPSGDMECRGADTPEEFARQRAKIISALVEINADVVGLIEIENYPGDVPVADLVSGLNAVLGEGTYAYIATGAIGTDAIRQAFIYKPATVSLVGSYAILDYTVDPRFLDDYNRPVLAQTFQDNATGGIFTVAVNHLKSKGSDCNAIGDPDTGDGSGNCNLTRLAAAQALVDWLAGDPTGSGDSDFLIIGDLNSYDKEDPIDAIKAGPDDILGTEDDYTDLILDSLGEYAYSYVFDGQIGYLDHSLANAALIDEVTGTTVWHINADEPDLIDYDMTFKQDAQDALYAPDAYRSSDHDPVIVGLSVCDEIAPTFEEVSVTPDVLWPVNHKYVEVIATVVVADNFDPNPTVTLVSVTSNEPDEGLGDGDMPDDIVIVDDYTFELRAERAGLLQDRVYTITYMVTDACGNSALASVTVTVPHDMRP